MIQDLHSHTYYSFCGKDRPEEIVEAAIRGGVTLFGICDHNYGIGCARTNVFYAPKDSISDSYERTLRRYFDHMMLIKDKYRHDVNVLCGIEICTLKTDDGRRLTLPDDADISYFDYCLIENLADPASVAGGDLVGYAERLRCKTGVAHTDMFSFIKSRGEDPLAYFTKMRERGIFWEMNVSCDSIHNYRQHSYMLHFFEDVEQQEIVRRSGVEISIGFDGHKVEDYLPDRVKAYCEKAEKLGLRLAFS